MSRRNTTPKLLTRPSPSTGRPLAYAKFDGRTLSFGPAGPDATAAFDRALAAWLANGRRLPADDDGEAFGTVADVVAAFLDHAEKAYVPLEYDNLKRAVAPLLEKFGDLPIEDLTVSCLEDVQLQLAERELARTTIRSRINGIRRCVRWAESRRLAPPGTWEHLRALEHLKPGRTKARETVPVDAVPWAWVEAVLPHLSTPLRAAVLVQWHAGLRPGEVLSLTGRQLQRTCDPWVYRPVRHKGVWRGRERVIRLGPRAQEALLPLLKLDPDAALIAPADTIAEQKVTKAQKRKTRVQPSQRRRAERAAAHPKLVLHDRYDVNTYRRAIHRACDVADVPRWSPHQLRHACAARLFEAGEVEAARAVLGHARLDMTRHYAKAADDKLAAEAMKRHG